MRLRHHVLSAITAISLSSPVFAQSPGTLELGAFVRRTWFDKSLRLDDRAGPGGRLGFFFVRNLAVEGDVSWTPTQDSLGQDISYLPIHARLVYNFALGEHTGFLLGAGYTHNEYGRTANASDDGGGAIAGFRLGTGELLSIRLDATVDYIPSPANEIPDVIDDNWNWAAQAGLSLQFGRRGPRDSDRDGVEDSLDRCPNTPAGETVDSSGCPLPKDSDGDGVPDPSDKCPNTPAGERVDSNGCPLPKDSDGDGVPDPNDQCPNTPAGTQVDEKGCPRDSDGDGVVDTADRCPGTPAGEKVDANGCVPPKDTDGDGVMDPGDKCPNTPAGDRVDAAGCSILFEPGKTAVILRGVNFETNKAILTPESRSILDNVAASLVANPDVRVEVSGYTDSRGSRALNARLSQARAAAVRAYLIEKGVPAANLTAKGYGPASPVAPNTTAAGRAQNRRVELHKLN